MKNNLSFIEEVAKRINIQDVRGRRSSLYISLPFYLSLFFILEDITMVLLGMIFFIYSLDSYLLALKLKLSKTEEYIMCSAIWYKELPLVEPKALENYGIRPYNVDKGIVFCGWRHGNCMYQMCAITGKPSVEDHVGEYVQGFLTSKNRFVDREEGFVIAKSMGQLLEPDKKYGETLYSEDVW